MKKDALISKDGLYRYWLLRQWDESLPLACYFGINPSVADAEIDDPTIRKEIGFSQRLGFGGLLKLNAGAFRATDPKEWRRAPDPIGSLNTISHLTSYLEQFKASKLFVCWGKNGQYARVAILEIERAFPSLWCFGRNGDGSPVHTLMLSYSVAPRRYCACRCHKLMTVGCGNGCGGGCVEGGVWEGV